MSDAVRIHPRFNGPPDSANGGYACGTFAITIDAAIVEVTLRRPPPLATDLGVRQGDDATQILHDDTLVAEVRDADELDIDIPAAPPLQRAHDAAARFRGHASHLFPTCFVCGPARSDGLALFPGDVDATGTIDGLLAAPWTPAAEYDIGDGSVDPRIVWSALDCPGGWATELSVSRPAVLGRMSAQLLRPVPIDTPLVVLGWSRGADGRKLYAGSAVCDPSGGPYAVAVATWISISGMA